MTIFRSLITLLLLQFLLSGCKKKEELLPPPPPAAATFFIRGADLSFTPEISTYGIQYTYNGAVLPMLTLMKNSGINTIRVRLWKNPSTVHSGLDEVTTFGAQIKNEGLKLWFDFHYSDTWADPGHQAKPAAWTTLTFDQLKDSVYVYTKNTLIHLKQNNATPDYIQLGNEVNDGILWEDGKIYGGANGDWINFSGLQAKATQAVREECPDAQIILHYSGKSYAFEFFDNAYNHQVDFDIIGLSYYSFWHGKDLDSLQLTLQSLRNSFGRSVVIAETAYPFTLGWNDYTFNYVGDSSHCTDGYPPSPEGQASFITKLIDIVRAPYTDNYTGVCYWAPDWVAYKGNVAPDGSSAENLALFNFQYEALPALDSLGRH